tara:strand:- start:3461 stop:5338 length:1878 start_codon:yes stop_codon:yes gene_type:complete
MAYKIGDTTVIDNSRELTAVGVTPSTNLVIPSGTTSNRPTGAVGKLYFDTDLGKLLVHDGTSWIVASTTADGDLAVHGSTYTFPINGGDENPNKITTYLPFNEAATNFTFTKRIHGSNNYEYWDAYVKIKGIPYEVQLMPSLDSHGTAGWPCPQKPYTNSGAVNTDVNAFQPHATLSLDNTAVNVNIGGAAAGGGASYAPAQSWIFDSKFPKQGFLIESQNSGWGLDGGGQGIYKYSDTQYVTFTNHNQLNASELSSGMGKINLRCYNPNNIVEGQDVTTNATNPVWNKDYDSTNAYKIRGMVYGVWKSATANQLTVMYTTNKGLTQQSSLGNPNWYQRINIFDINMTTGAVVSNSTISHDEFRPTSSNSLNTGTPLMPSGHGFTVCECSTHVTMCSWPDYAGGSTHPFAFWIWDKANRDLRVFQPELYDDSTFNSSSLSNQSASYYSGVWMNHFKMNDKIYLATKNTGATHNTHQGVHIYETSSTSATPYMRIYNDTNNDQIFNARSQFQQLRPLFSNDTITYSHLGLYDWNGANYNTEGETALMYSGVTVNPETDKGMIQTKFGPGTKSGAWSSSNNITYYTNPVKQSNGTTLWTDSAGTNGSNQGGWKTDMTTRKFFGGGTQ